MSTDNPKISFYVSQKIYDRFKEFKKKQEKELSKSLSISEVGQIILAEYFGLPETIKKFTEGTSIGGVTLADFKKLKSELEDLKDKVITLDRQYLKGKVEQRNSIDNPLIVDNNKKKQLAIEDVLKQTDLSKKGVSSIEKISETFSSSEIFINSHLLAKRLGLKNVQSLNNKKCLIYKDKEHDANLKFSEWSKGKDIDGIGWKAVKQGKRKTVYSPYQEISNELLSSLNRWITQNQS